MRVNISALNLPSFQVLRESMLEKSFEKDYLAIKKRTSSPEKPSIKHDCSPKSVIFCLALRKLYKSSYARYTKFTFFLIRSLFKETQINLRKSVDSSSPYRSIKKIKKMSLNKLYNTFTTKTTITIKQKIFSYIKNRSFRSVADTYTSGVVNAVIKIFKKFFTRKLKTFFRKCLCKNIRLDKLNPVIERLKYLVDRKVIIAILNNKIVVRTFSVLIKPKKMLPIMKIRSKKEDLDSFKVAFPQKKVVVQSSQLNQHEDSNSKKSLVMLSLLTRNYYRATKRAFNTICQNSKDFQLKKTLIRPLKFRSIICRMVIPRFLMMTNTLYHFYQSKLNATYFIQSLDYLLYKSNMNNKSFSFLALRKPEKKQNFHLIEDKILLNLTDILKAKVFNKCFIGFILIKRFAYSNKKAIKKKSEASLKFLKFLQSVYKKKQLRGLSHSFNKLFQLYKSQKSLENLLYLSRVIKKIRSRIYFNYSIQSFQLLKSIRSRKSKGLGKKLFYLLKRSYIKRLSIYFL
jgi:hypothetical protein